jgi:hypothetical protein
MLMRVLVAHAQNQITETVTVAPAPAGSALALSVAPGGRYLQNGLGSPFLIAGDAAMALFQALPLTGSSSGDASANATFYFSTRSSQGINAVWATAVCSTYAACTGNNSQTYDGLVPFNGTISSCGSTIPNCWDMTTAGQGSSANYWARMDAMVNLAATYGIVIFWNPVTTGGCNTFPSSGSNPVWITLVNNHNAANGSHTNAYAFGQFLGNRYKSFPNIVWLHGDDYICNGQGGGSPAADDLPVMDIMNGIAAAGDTHLQTIELWSLPPSSSFDNADFIPPNGKSNVNGVYTYNPTYVETLHAWNQATAPVLLLEANYEWDNILGYEPNDPNCGYRGRASACEYEYTLRKEYWDAALAGSTAGFINGNSLTAGDFCLSPSSCTPGTGWTNNMSSPGFVNFGYWKSRLLSLLKMAGGFCLHPSSCTPGTGWTNYMSSPGFVNFGYWKSLLLSLPWWVLTPDQNNNYVTSGRGTAYSSLASCTINSHANCFTPDNYVTASSYSTSSTSGLVAYIPCYATTAKYRCTGTGGLTVAMNQVGANPTARWYDPTAGTFTTICSPSGTPCSGSSQTFTPAGVNGAGDPDWVLVVSAQAVSRG